MPKRSLRGAITLDLAKTMVGQVGRNFKEDQDWV